MELRKMRQKCKKKLKEPENQQFFLLFVENILMSVFILN